MNVVASGGGEQLLDDGAEQEQLQQLLRLPSIQPGDPLSSASTPRNKTIKKKKKKKKHDPDLQPPQHASENDAEKEVINSKDERFTEPNNKDEQQEAEEETDKRKKKKKKKKPTDEDKKSKELNEKDKKKKKKDKSKDSNEKEKRKKKGAEPSPREIITAQNDYVETPRQHPSRTLRTSIGEDIFSFPSAFYSNLVTQTTTGGSIITGFVAGISTSPSNKFNKRISVHLYLFSIP